jgi:hypothetical protein
MKRLRFHRHPGLISSHNTIKLIPYLKIQTKLNTKPRRIIKYVKPDPFFVFTIELGFLKWEYSLIYEYERPEIKY